MIERLVTFTEVHLVLFKADNRGRLTMQELKNRHGQKCKRQFTQEIKKSLRNAIELLLEATLQAYANANQGFCGRRVGN